jgi:hypothetical protein
MPRKKKTAAANGNLSKSDFIRSQPADMPAKEVVAKAKAAGLSISDNYVYTLRYEAKKKAGKTTEASKGAKKLAGAKSTTVSSSGVEDLLRAAASEIGLSRAISILQEQQNTLRSVLGR